MNTYSKGIEPLRDGLSTELHGQRVVACIFDGIIYIEGSIAVVFDININITEKRK